MSKLFNISFGSFTGFILIFSILFTPIILNQNLNLDTEIAIDTTNKEFIHTNSTKPFSWPSPGYTTITCGFGYRKAPASGASTYHGAIDIGAPSNSKVIASFSGKVIYTGFYGACGYTVMVQNSNVTALYCHLSPEFIVKKDEFVSKNQVIAHVGPKNVYGVPNNKYRDANSNPTNGATTGPHLHFAIKIDNKTVNPLEYV